MCIHVGHVLPPWYVAREKQIKQLFYGRTGLYKSPVKKEFFWEEYTVLQIVSAYVLNVDVVGSGRE